MRPDQLADEIGALLAMVREAYGWFGLEPRYAFATKPDGAIGDAALWERAEGYIREALERAAVPYTVKPKDGTFYAPKIDIYIDDALGREWQMATIQADLTMLPERFDLTYIDEHGQPQRPIAIHRAIYGSLERFIGILVEHYAGAFPLWLAPVQAVVIPIADRHIEAAEELATLLRSRGLRVEVDDSSNRMQYKIRAAQEQKVPYMLVLGDREIEARTASPRTRAGEQQGRRTGRPSPIASPRRRRRAASAGRGRDRKPPNDRDRRRRPSRDPRTGRRVEVAAARGDPAPAARPVAAETRRAALGRIRRKALGVVPGRTSPRRAAGSAPPRASGQVGAAQVRKPDAWYVSTWATLAGAVLGRRRGSADEPPGAGDAPEVLRQAKEQRAQAAFAEALATGRPLPEAVRDAVGALAAVDAWHAAWSLAEGVGRLPDGAVASAIGHAVLHHRRRQFDRAWTDRSKTSTTPSLTQVIPVEAVDAALAAGAAGSPPPRPVHQRPVSEAFSAATVVDLAGRFLAVGERDRAAALIVELR